MHVGLTDRAQSAAAARALRTVRADTLLTSDQARAAQSAEIIGALCDLVPRSDAVLREQALGDLEGSLVSELVALPDPPGHHSADVRWGGPRSESVVDVHQRVGGLLRPLLDDPPGRRIILVSHGDTMRVALSWLRGLGPYVVDWVDVPNGCITKVGEEEIRRPPGR